jgi:putative ABC transport system permease protein
MRSLWRFLRGGAADRELADEMREHIAEKEDEYIAAGMPPAEAGAKARRQFGNPASLAERSADEWGFALARNLVSDLRFGMRSIRKNPLFTAVVVLPLALGIGANTAIFAVVHAALIRPLPYRDAERLVHLFEIHPSKEHGPYEASYPDYKDWITAQSAFEGMAGYTRYGRAITWSQHGDPEQLAGAAATSAFFPLLGVKAAAGRTFAPSEDEPGGARVVMLSYGFWQRRLNGDSAIVGRTLTLNGGPRTVIGVLPADFHFAAVRDADVWLPLVASSDQRKARYWHWVNVIGRLRPGATPAQARAEMGAIGERIVNADREHHDGTSIILQPIAEVLTGDVRPVLLALLGAIGMVLLLACANVANLLLARAAARRKELALRASLGAGRARLVQQLLTESLLLACIGGVLGIGVAQWGIRALTAAVPPDMRGTMPFLEGLGVHWGMAAFTAGGSLATGLLFGLAPALRLARTDLAASLESGHRASGGREHLRLRHALLVAEVAISLVLLTGAGLMMRSTARLLAVNPGFDSTRLLTMEVAAPRAYNTYAKLATFHSRLMDQIASMPGVTGVGTTSALPLKNAGNTGTLRVEGLPESTVYVRNISAGYLRTLGIPVVAGRSFDERDREGSPRVVMVNRRLVSSVFPTEDPIGKHISFPWSKGELEIVGVVGDENTVSLDTELRPVVYFAHDQDPDDTWGLVVRTSGTPAGAVGAIRAAVRALDPETPVYDVKTMEQVIADSPSTVMRRYPAMLMAAFAAIALVMAVIGTYGLVAYGVSQRLHEIGVRIALGATPADILRLVMRQGIVLALAGIAVGLGCAALVTRGLEKLLFGVGALDPVTFAGVALVLLGAALAASFLPARRATRVAPGVIL